MHARGDWSKKLHALEFNCDSILYKWPPEKPIRLGLGCHFFSPYFLNIGIKFLFTRFRLYVDGPYSSPMEEIVKSRIVIGIAAGVGITPFMSSIWHLL